MSKPDNTPAFPLAFSSVNGAIGVNVGMSLRDWFAGQALLSIERFGAWPPSHWAEKAYAIADAMLSERDKDAPR